MASLALHEQLCALKEPRFSATDMIKDLIDYLSITLASSGTRRNTHTLCTAVSRSRDLCDKINSLISASSTEDGWASFDTYTVMINPLEKYLLELSEISETSCIASLSGGLLISEWIEAGILWTRNRKTTTETLTGLFEAEYFKEIGTICHRSGCMTISRFWMNCFYSVPRAPRVGRQDFRLVDGLTSKPRSESWTPYGRNWRPATKLT
ncbi:hypothetical protein BDZ89DRAFT_387014 [Hymenopellis radicata]|nr:hypothetical protein BDZ89DRAFT_387014 [Hymenopellis radicata]